VNGFIDHLYTPLGTTSTYSSIANLHNSYITTAHANPIPAWSVFTSRCLVTALNNDDSPVSVLTSLQSGKYPTTLLKLEVTLRLTVSMSWCRAPSGAYDQIYSYITI
jgi:hypothetical protein